jgi:hypothetical protein
MIFNIALLALLFSASCMALPTANAPTSTWDLSIGLYPGDIADSNSAISPVTQLLHWPTDANVIDPFPFSRDVKAEGYLSNAERLQRFVFDPN